MLACLAELVGHRREGVPGPIARVAQGKRIVLDADCGQGWLVEPENHRIAVVGNPEDPALGGLRPAPQSFEEVVGLRLAVGAADSS